MKPNSIFFFIPCVWERGVSYFGLSFWAMMSDNDLSESSCASRNQPTDQEPIIEDSDDEIQFKSKEEKHTKDACTTDYSDTMSISLSQKSSQESMSSFQESHELASQSSQDSFLNDGDDSKERLSDICHSQGSGVENNSCISSNGSVGSIVSFADRMGTCAMHVYPSC